MVKARESGLAVNYISKRDFVGTLNKMQKHDSQTQVVRLTPHAQAPAWDHDVQSPTYRRSLVEQVEEFKQFR